jgi:hypothetical protein
LLAVLLAACVLGSMSQSDGSGAEPNRRLSSTPPATQPAGIAARHASDAEFAKDPAIILYEDFEGADLDKRKWPGISNNAGALALTRDPNEVFAGRQSLQVTATLGKNTGGHLFRRFEKGYEQLYARFCVKFAKDCDYIHHFVHMAAELPAVPWPTGGAGELPAGDKKFTVGIEPWGRWGKYPPPGGWHFYCYWWKMKKSPDGKYWGNDFAPAAYSVPERGRWYCVEFMTKCNTPGKEDGQVALWIDGNAVAHHKDINWRSDGNLKLNAFWLMLYVTENSTKNQVNTVWFDDVVVATEYIGPPRGARASAPPSQPAGGIRGSAHGPGGR